MKPMYWLGPRGMTRDCRLTDAHTGHRRLCRPGTLVVPDPELLEKHPEWFSEQPSHPVVASREEQLAARVEELEAIIRDREAEAWARVDELEKAMDVVCREYDQRIRVLDDQTDNMRAVIADLSAANEQLAARTEAVLEEAVNPEYPPERVAMTEESGAERTETDILAMSYQDRRAWVHANLGGVVGNPKASDIEYRIRAYFAAT